MCISRYMSFFYYVAKEEWDNFVASLPEDRTQWTSQDKDEEASLRNSYYTLQKLTNKASENTQGIFWFTPDGVYQERNKLYFYSSERMSFTTKPLLIESTNGK